MSPGLYVGQDGSEKGNPDLVSFYRVEKQTAVGGYVGDTVDTDGDQVPDTWDAYPEDASLVADTDGDGHANKFDAFPLDDTRHESTDSSVVPVNNIYHYRHCCSDNSLHLDVGGLANLEMVVGADVYKAVGRLVKLTLADAIR